MADAPEIHVCIAVATAAAMHPELLKPVYRRRVEEGAHPLTGHCYVASELLFHALGGHDQDEFHRWTPHTTRINGEVHWYLRHQIHGSILDPTGVQFGFDYWKLCEAYLNGRGRGFPTREMSSRAKKLLKFL